MPASENNPFPGMNPFLQANWPGVHSRLISYMADALANELPDDLAARPEEHVALEEGDEKIHRPRADIAVVEPWQSGFPPLRTWSPETGEVRNGDTLTAAVPFLLIEERVPERWIEIQDADGKLVTVIELLSPSNKSGQGAVDYRARQRRFLAGGVRLVEIDLIRGGRHALAYPAEHFTLPPGVPYVICTTRVSQDGQSYRHEIYPCPLREPLPTIRVPLRRGEPDVPLALQPLVNRVYRTGRYWLTMRGTNRELNPPAADPAEADWIEERRRQVVGPG